MAAFDPDRDLETQADHDAYVQWCARELMAIADKESETHRVYGTAMHAAAWLWVVAQAQLHLHEDVVERREGHQQNLAALFTRARAVERAHGDIRVAGLFSARVALDCFVPAGKYAASLLEATKMAVDALVLVFTYPPVDKWNMTCPGAWALILCGVISLDDINEHTEPLTYEDYSVRPSSEMTQRIVWDAANRAARRVGAEPPSHN